jgi:hypothetical protein
LSENENPQAHGDLTAGNAQQAVMTLNQANKNWCAHRLADRMQTAIQNAEMNAASAGSNNIANAYRQAFKPILRDIQSGKLKDPEVLSIRHVGLIHVDR